MEVIENTRHSLSPVSHEWLGLGEAPEAFFYYGQADFTVTTG